MVIIVFGLPGSGKSFFAERLAHTLHARYVNSDIIRKEMFKERFYSEEERGKVYEEMADQMIRAVDQRQTIVLDATFYRKKIRDYFKIKAEKPGVPVKFIEVWANEQLIRERTGVKREHSEAGFNVYLELKKEFESLDDPHLVLESTNNNLEELISKAVVYLSEI